MPSLVACSSAAGRWLAAASLASALLWPAAARADDLFAGFSLSANPSGPWSFGQAATPGGAFTLLPAIPFTADGTHASLSGWADQGDGAPVIAINTSGAQIIDGNVNLPTGVVLLHGDGVTPLAATVRWQAPAAGVYQVEAVFTVHQIHAHAAVSAWTGGTALFSKVIEDDGTSTAFSQAVILGAGDALSFAVNRGGPDANGFAGNWVGLQLNISPVPEPGAAALLLAGLAGCGWVVRRRRVP